MSSIARRSRTVSPTIPKHGVPRARFIYRLARQLSRMHLMVEHSFRDLARLETAFSKAVSSCFEKSPTDGFPERRNVLTGFRSFTQFHNRLEPSVRRSALLDCNPCSVSSLREPFTRSASHSSGSTHGSRINHPVGIKCLAMDSIASPSLAPFRISN